MFVVQIKHKEKKKTFYNVSKAIDKFKLNLPNFKRRMHVYNK